MSYTRKKSYKVVQQSFFAVNLQIFLSSWMRIYYEKKVFIPLNSHKLNLVVCSIMEIDFNFVQRLPLGNIDEPQSGSLGHTLAKNSIAFDFTHTSVKSLFKHTPYSHRIEHLHIVTWWMAVGKLEYIYWH